MSQAEIWSAFERLRHGAVAAEWRRGAGDFFPRLKPWLRLLPRLANSVPVYDAYGYCRRFHVVEHGPEDFVAVSEEDGDRFRVDRADLLLYGLCVEGLAAALATAFGLEPSYQDGGSPNPRPIGTAGAGSTRRSAWLLVGDNAKDLAVPLCDWALSSPKQAVLFTFTPTSWSRPIEALLQQQRVSLAAICDCVELAEGGKLQVRVPFDELISSSDASRRPNVFAFRNGGWKIVYSGVECNPRDAVGLHYLRKLLAQPNTPIDASLLRDGHSALVAAAPDSRQVFLDSAAKKSLRDRLFKLSGERDRANALNDPVLLRSLDDEFESIQSELRRTVGLAGRPREMQGGKSRPEKGVVNAIQRAIRSIKQVHLPLGTHLENSVTTGKSCQYCPEVDADWQT
jgi:hypothetical protein